MKKREKRYTIPLTVYIDAELDQALREAGETLGVSGFVRTTLVQKVLWPK